MCLQITDLSLGRFNLHHRFKLLF